MALNVLNNTGPGKGLSPDGAYLLPEPLFIHEVLWHSPEDNFTRNAPDIYPWYEFENYLFKIIATSPRGQWVNHMCISFRTQNIRDPLHIQIMRSLNSCENQIRLIYAVPLKCTPPITTKFCTTRHDSYTVVTCAKFRCDQLSILQTRALQILIQFRLFTCVKLSSDLFIFSIERRVFLTRFALCVLNYGC